VITPSDVRIAEYIIDTSGIVDTLHGGRRTSRRGRPADLDLAKALWVGMLLSIQFHGRATLREIHTLLTRELCDTDKKRLKVLRGGEHIAYSKLVNYSKSLKNKLAFGRSAGDIDDTERAERHNTVVTAVDDLMEVFNLDWTTTRYAIDATGLWSWARGKGKFTPGELVDEDDPDFDPDTQPQPTVDNQSADPDASWQGKTAKGGNQEGFFGYHGHAIVQVPNKTGDKFDEPLIVRRIEITTAAQDIVDVSLRLIDGLGSITDLLEDRHYSYKKWERWHVQLNERGVRQHFDMFGTKREFIEYDHMRWVDGSAHCPATPDRFETILRPKPNAPKEDFEAFRAQIAARQDYAMYVTERNADGSTLRLQCPALTGTVGCPLRPGTDAAAIEKGRPVVANPPDPNGPEGLPLCCTQTKVSVTTPVKIRKVQQQHYWGSPTWERTYAKRTHIEGVFGNLKNDAAENLSRGLTRGMGLVWMNMVVAMTAASYNRRTLRKWHEETGHGPADHPLLQPIIQPSGFEYRFDADPGDEPEGGTAEAAEAA
jgi:hypothetical protein